VSVSSQPLLAQKGRANRALTDFCFEKKADIACKRFDVN